MARRFIIDCNLDGMSVFEITGEEARHIFVLRHNVGDIIEINNKKCEIVGISKQSVKCNVIGEAVQKGIPNVKITLYQALLKADKMEYVIQKAVELGVSRIVPFVSKNVVVKLDDNDKTKKVERFNKISREASKQCGRSDVVEVSAIETFSEVIEDMKGYKNSIIAYENEISSLKKFLKENRKIDEIAIVIGAEGGFEFSEVNSLTENGCVSVSLGDRVLRAETASLNLISILMYELN